LLLTKSAPVATRTRVVVAHERSKPPLLNEDPSTGGTSVPLAAGEMPADRGHRASEALRCYHGPLSPPCMREGSASVSIGISTTSTNLARCRPGAPRLIIHKTSKCAAE